MIQQLRREWFVFRVLLIGAMIFFNWALGEPLTIWQVIAAYIIYQLAIANFAHIHGAAAGWYLVGAQKSVSMTAAREQAALNRANLKDYLTPEESETLDRINARIEEVQREIVAQEMSS